MKAPFPYFGGKSRVADLVWQRFGNPKNYVEPFAGSLAVLLARDDWRGAVETVNDADCMISNFWRATQSAPDEVAKWADYPVHEDSLHARHNWLVNSEYSRAFREKMKTDPDYFDAKIAGWWVWGISQWIGSGWCVNPDLRRTNAGRAPRGINTMDNRRPCLQTGQGVNRISEKRPLLSRGVDIQRQRNIDNSSQWRKRPQLASSRGVCKLTQKLPILGNYGVGVHSKTRIPDCRPSLHSSSTGIGALIVEKSGGIYEYFEMLRQRLRRVRVCCGDWARITGPAVTTCIGTTAVFLDPPYAQCERDASIYSVESDVSAQVRQWALENGNNPKLRIALCGYEGEHEMPADWECIAWKANGGYGANGTGRGASNRHRERIWFSPYCLKPDQSQLEMF